MNFCVSTSYFEPIFGYNRIQSFFVQGSKIVQDTSMKLGDDIRLGEQDDVELDPNLAENKYPDLSGAKSIMSKYLTKEVFEKLKDKKSSTGFTIARAVNSGVRNKEKSLMGCHAGYVMMMVVTITMVVMMIGMTMVGMIMVIIGMVTIMIIVMMVMIGMILGIMMMIMMTTGMMVIIGMMR